MPGKRHQVVMVRVRGQRSPRDDLELTIRRPRMLRDTHLTWGSLFVMEGTADGLMQVWLQKNDPVG